METSYITPTEGPPVRLRPGKWPFLTITGGSTLLYYLVMKYTLLPWLSAPYSQFWYLWICLHIFGFTGCYLFTMYVYWILWKTQPSTVPENWTPDREAIDPLSNDKKIRYCEKCEAWQPPRCYHCKICKRCVLMRDQHCPWMNGCIGFGNTKYYLLFLFSMINYLSLSMFITASWIGLSVIGSDFETCYWNVNFNCWIITIITIIPGIFFCLFLFFLIWQIQLVSINTTNQEYNAYMELRDRNRLKIAGGMKWTDAEIERWPYDLPDPMDNFNQFLGPRFWYSPAYNQAVNDGTRFPLNEQWKEQRNANRVSEQAELI